MANLPELPHAALPTFQQIRLYDDLSVLENVMVAGHASIRYSFVEAVFGFGRFSADERRTRSKAEYLLELMGLIETAAEKAESLPYGRPRQRRWPGLGTGTQASASRRAGGRNESQGND
jgi:ABC-type branched-subunit amino acid transport system ATPase component